MTDSMIDAIISCLIICETGNGTEPAPEAEADYRVNYSEQAVGCLQIRECMVDECNRIANGNRFWWYADRFNRVQSVEMAPDYFPKPQPLIVSSNYPTPEGFPF